ncbi:MAG: stage II sporulation protein M [Candidatus Azobacteroides sp.]|nr:stage II sporulation protein M [Candidatus Azobacteroides sp.]
MKEAVFVRQNRGKWKRYEDCLKNIGQQSPDALADIYIDITNDLSFAQSQYPNSRIYLYLNSLSIRLHQFINRKKKEKFSRIFTYWKQEVPLVMYHARKELLYSFLIFVVSVLIGIFSTANDADFPRLILGDSYVNMTLSNIENGDPMAVYKDMHSGIMFFGITVNNIWVSFYIFIYGMFTSIASAYILIQNGIMLGCFQYFFYDYGFLKESFLTIWIHGTLEISAIIVAGAAGITMGNGWLFPGTYSRIVSFRKSAQRGMKIIVGIVPIFIIAGFLESFVTRYTELPDFVRAAIILLSLSFVIFYYIIYPRKLSKVINNNTFK